jgi:hypothetical protein
MNSKPNSLNFKGRSTKRKGEHRQSQLDGISLGDEMLRLLTDKPFLGLELLLDFIAQLIQLSPCAASSGPTARFAV